MSRSKSHPAHRLGVGTRQDAANRGSQQTTTVTQRMQAENTKDGPRATQETKSYQNKQWPAIPQMRHIQNVVVEVPEVQTIDLSACWKFHKVRSGESTDRQALPNSENLEFATEEGMHAMSQFNLSSQR